MHTNFTDEIEGEEEKRNNDLSFYAVGIGVVIMITLCWGILLFASMVDVITN